MWTLENRPRYNRDHLRYPSDLTDDEWACVAPLIPPPKPGGGKKLSSSRRVAACGVRCPRRKAAPDATEPFAVARIDL
jgi:hypothetical protein